MGVWIRADTPQTVKYIELGISARKFKVENYVLVRKFEIEIDIMRENSK